MNALYFFRLASEFFFLLSFLLLLCSPVQGQLHRIYSFDSIDGQANQPPPSPCPQIFQYQHDNNVWTGRIAVPPPANIDSTLRRVSSVRLDVMLYLPALLPSKYFGKLELAESNEIVWQKVVSGSSNRPILYRLHFPVTSPLPYLTLVRVNGNIICSGSVDSHQSRYRTSITLAHTFYPIVNYLQTGGVLSNEEKKFTAGNPQFTYSNVNSFNDGLNKENQPQVVSYINTDEMPSIFNLGNPISGDQHGVHQPVGANNFYSGDYQPIQGSSTINAPTSSSIKPVTQAVSFNTENEHPYIKPPSNQGGNPQLQQFSSLTDFLKKQERNCGKPLVSNNLIVQGKPVTKRGDWPWVVAIFENISDGVGIKFHCSGSLISRYYVLTAAHCTSIFDKELSINRQLTPDRLIVFLGKFNLIKWTEPGAKIKEVKNIFVHPNYGTNGDVGADLAVLQLSSHAEYSPYVQAACIWPSRTSDGAREDSDITPLIGKLGTVVGWGRDEHGNKVTSEPRLARIPIVSQEECLRSEQSFTYLTSNKTFCAGFRNGTGPCNGDSGGGLMIPVPEDDGRSEGNVRWFLRGIVSLSLRDNKTGVCDLNNYIIFTDVAKYGDWIAQFY